MVFLTPLRLYRGKLPLAVTLRGTVATMTTYTKPDTANLIVADKSMTVRKVHKMWSSMINVFDSH